MTYYQPNVLIPSPNVLTNQPDRYRDFNGFELTFQKRTANNWSMNASYAYNNAIDRWDSANDYEDPTNIDELNGFQYAPEAAGSGIGGIFTNAKWLVKVNGRYTMKWDINLAANYQARQGYPYLQTILSPARANGAGQVQTQLDPLGDLRLDNLQTLDFRVDKTLRFGSFTVVPAMGKVVTGDGQPYRYLVESIRTFPRQEDFKAMIAAAGFARAGYRNLSGGIVAIHWGWRI